MTQLRQNQIRDAVQQLIEAFGLASDEQYAATPDRVAAFYQEYLETLHAPPPELPLYPVSAASNELIALRDIPFYSLCSHHLLPFFGSVAVVYQPASNEVLGFSGVIRIVNYFSRRPALQESMASQIANHISKCCPGASVLVEIRARHLCTEMRGIQTRGQEIFTVATSNATVGEAWEQRARNYLTAQS